MKKSFIVESYNSFDSFLRWQLFTGFVASLTWSLSVPIIHKLQGFYWTTAYISIYLIFIRMSGLIMPFFKGAKLKNLYFTIIVLNTFYALSLFVYFYDVHIFLWVEVGLSIIYSVAAPLLGIGWDVYVVKEYPEDVFENFRYWEAIKDSLGGIIGSAIVAIMASLTSLDQTVMTFISAMFMMLIIQHVNWNKFYKKM
tara:strand:- start:1182 stop:1772 length:591 start_codon:yes stop_codon:yes gene_type:complete